jgi:hypothetical protein
MKHLQTFGLMVVAVMALVAFVGTTSASAAKFTAGKVGAKFVGETKVKHVFSITGSSSECTNISFEGATEALETTELSYMMTVSGCTAFGFASTHVSENCKTIIHADGRTTIKPTFTELLPCVTKTIINNAFAQCEVVITNQEIPSKVSYTNSGTGHITLKFNGAANIAAEVTKSSGLCPLTVGKHTNAHYSGETTLKAEGTTLAWDA